MDLMGRLGATLRIQPGEGRLVSLVLAYGYLLGLGRTFCAAAVSGMFLALFGAEALPYTFIGAALAVPITGVIYLRLRERLPLARLIAWAVGLLIVALLSFRAALAVGQPPPLVFALMISYTIVYVLVSLSFWGLAGQLFNVRQGKRLFGLLGSGSEVADISGGLLTLALAPLIGASNLLFLAAGGLSVALLVERAIVRRYPLSADQPDDEEHEPAPGVAEVLRGGFVRAIFLMLALSQIAYFLVENSFYDLATTHFAGA